MVCSPADAIFSSLNQGLFQLGLCPALVDGKSDSHHCGTNGEANSTGGNGLVGGVVLVRVLLVAAAACQGQRAGDIPGACSILATAICLHRPIIVDAVSPVGTATSTATIITALICRSTSSSPSAALPIIGTACASAAGNNREEAQDDNTHHGHLRNSDCWIVLSLARN